MTSSPADQVPMFAPSRGGCARPGCGHLYGTCHRDGPCSVPGCGCSGFVGADADGPAMAIALVMIGAFVIALMVYVGHA